MKHILAILALATSLQAMSHTIKGTLPKEGRYKSQTTINGILVKCDFRIQWVKNLLTDQDDWGNPGYRVRADIKLDGRHAETSEKIKMSKEMTFHNLFVVDGKKMIKDNDFFAEKDKSTLKINDQGQVTQVSFAYQDKFYTCRY